MGLLTYIAVIAALGPSQGIANKMWGPSHCGKPNYKIYTQDKLNQIRSRESSTTHNKHVSADANIHTCVIRIARDAYTSKVEVCNVGVHENGHLRQLIFNNNPFDPIHSLNRKSVMHSSAYELLPECIKAFPPSFVKRQSKMPQKLRWKCSPDIAFRGWRCLRRGNIKYV